MSETYYVGGQGDEVADYAQTYKPGPLSLLGGVIVLTAATLRAWHSIRAAPAVVPPPAAV